MLMTYGNVYVAQVAMGADNAQLIRAIHEAEQFKGEHHCRLCTLHRAWHQARDAECAGGDEAGGGCRLLVPYRYNPNAEPRFQLDSKADA